MKFDLELKAVGTVLTFILLLIGLDKDNPVAIPTSEFLLASTEGKEKEKET